MIVGAIILIAITLSSARLDKLLPFLAKSTASRGSTR
jgi:simple sugar transport system permease protein